MFKLSDFLVFFVVLNLFISSLISANETLTATQIWEKMLLAQSGLKDFTARVSLSSKLGILPLPKLSGEISTKRPSQVQATMAGVTFTPQHPYLFPDPLQFTGTGYHLTLVDCEETADATIFVIDVTPTSTEAQPLSMRFWISSSNWLIFRSDMSIPGGGRTIMDAEYIQAAPNAWVPTKLSGTGGLLLADLLPPSGLGKLLASLLNSDHVEFTAILSEHQVNIGL